MRALPTLRARPVGRSEVITWIGAIALTSAAFGVGLIFVNSLLLVVLLAVGAIAAVVTFGRPSAATYAVIAILYSNIAAVAVRDHGLPDIVGLAFPLLLAWPLADLLLMRRKPLTITASLPYLFGYLVVQVISALGAQDTGEAADSLMRFVISGFGLYFVLTNVVRTFTSLRYAVWTVILVAAGLGALSTFQAVTRTYSNTYWGLSTVDVPQPDEVSATQDATPRHEGPIGEKNRYGQIMLVLLPIGVLLSFGERKRWLRIAALGLTFLILCGMVTSFSRGAAFGLLVVLFVAVLFRYVRLVHLGLLAGLLLVVLVAFPRYTERIVDLQALTNLDRNVGGSQVQGDAGNLRGRETATLAALFAWADHPLLGVGRGQFDSVYERYAEIVADAGVDVRIRIGSETEAHNLYASIGAETGILGFLFFFGMFARTMRDLYRARTRWLTRRPDVSHLATGFLLAVIAYLASGIALHLSYERYLWLLLALAGAAAHMALNGDPDRDFDVELDDHKGREDAPAPALLTGRA